MDPSDDVGCDWRLRYVVFLLRSFSLSRHKRVGGVGTGASGPVEDTLRPGSIIGCSAWPCKLIVDFVMETDLRPQARGGCVCKEASSSKQSMIVVLIVLNLVLRDL